MSSQQRSFRLGAVAIAAAVLTQVLSSAGAAPITWGAATNVSGSGDQVVTTGTLVQAWYATNDNSVLKTLPVTGASGTSVLFRSGTSPTFPTAPTGGNNAGFNSFVSGSYASLLNGRVIAAFASYNWDIAGLTVGQQYLIQFWSNSPSIPNTNNTSLRGLTSGSVSGPTGTLNGITGQFVTGNFTADSTTQVVRMSGTRIAVNAVQIRAVPEPSTLALASLGIVGVGTWFGRRRMRRVAEEAAAADAGITA